MLSPAPRLFVNLLACCSPIRNGFDHGQEADQSPQGPAKAANSGLEDQRFRRDRAAPLRGRTEIARIEALEPNLGPYGTFRARSSGGGLYEVEIRDLAGRTNSCGCADHRVNGLGTCKHIEGVLFALRKKLGARAFAAAVTRGSPRVEVFLRRDGDPAPSLGGSAPSAEARAFLDPF